MSTAPGATGPKTNNTQLYIMVGIIGAVVVLCGGFFAMSLFTMQVIGRGLDTHRYAGGTGPTQEEPSSEQQPTKGLSNAELARDVARQFTGYLQRRQVEKAHSLTLDTFDDADEFRQRMDRDPVVYGSNETSLTRMSGGQPGEVDFTVVFRHATKGSSRYSMRVVEASDGTWKVQSFGRQ
jgi:hypothetical protein